MPDTAHHNPTAVAGTPSRRPLLRNDSILVAVLSNWLWYVLVLVSGFILPRLIHERQGTELLGVWDLGWALKIYLDWLALGVGSAMNRYVARYRAVRDWDSLNAHFNSSLALLSGSCAVGFLSLVGLWALVPAILVQSGPEVVETARWVVILLGIAGSLKLPGGAFNGVITGYSRFDVLNLVRGTRDLVVLLLDVALLISGYGIVALAVMELASEIAGDFARIIAARRLCPTLRVSLRLCDRAAIREVLSFGSKTLVRGLANGGLYQVNSVLITYFLGAPALAVYSRQRALVTHVLHFINQYAQVFIPASSRLDAKGDTEALRRLLIDASKHALYVMTPLTVTLCVMGGPFVSLWMGPGYEAPTVLAILAIGHLLSGPQFGAYSMLMGMGRHGRPALYELLTTAGGIVLGLTLMGVLRWGLVGAAISVGVAVALGRGAAVAWYACRLVDLSVARYVKDVALGPALTSVPLAICLIVARLSLPDHPVRALVTGLAVGGLITAAVYWRWVVGPRLARRWRRDALTAALLTDGASPAKPAGPSP
jgi:O-antigen/teichoic acid export membrane protein